MSLTHVRNLFRENRKNTKVVCLVMWTYDICAFDTGTYCLFFDKITIFCNDVNKTSTSVEFLHGNNNSALQIIKK